MCLCNTLVNLLVTPIRVEKSQSAGQPQRPSPTGSSPPPVTCGAMAWSCGRWCHMESDHTGTSPTEMWALRAIINSKRIFMQDTGASCLLCFTCAGDQISGRGLQAACSYGLPCCSTHAHAGLLAEGSQREAALLPDSHRSRQANPQPREPEVYGHTLQVGGAIE